MNVLIFIDYSCIVNHYNSISTLQRGVHRNSPQKQGEFTLILKISWNKLESQLLEEPLVLSSAISLLKLHADLKTGLLALDGIFQVLGGVFVHCNVWHAVSGGHQMVTESKLS